MGGFLLSLICKSENKMQRNKAPLPKPKPAKTFLFHKDYPKGKSFLASEIEGLKEKGWVDTPAKLDLPKEEKTVKEEQVKEMQPQELVSLVKTMGYTVLTETEMRAEINKAAMKLSESAATIENFTDAELIAEAEKRGLKDGEGEEEPLTIEDMQDVFNEDPEALNKDELVHLGNEKFKLGLRENMKEATLIEKITESMNKG